MFADDREWNFGPGEPEEPKLPLKLIVGLGLVALGGIAWMCLQVPKAYVPPVPAPWAVLPASVAEQRIRGV